MGVLDQVMDLKSQGASDYEISRRLREQGVSPGDINDAFAKAQIKSAVTDTGSTDGMQPSILGSEEEPERLPLEGLEGGTLSDEDLTPPKPGGYPMQMAMPVTKEMYGEQEVYSPQEMYSPQAQYAQAQPQQEGYEYAQYQPSVSSGDTDTIIEVAEQVFFEKNKPLQKKLDDMSEFKTLVQTKVDNISDRLRRMESIIDKLQASILEKIGSYGSGLETVRKEMGMMQESFGKVVGKLADASETRHHTHRQHQIHHTSPQNTEHHVTVQKSVKKTTR
jgi:hypothetical protein